MVVMPQLLQLCSPLKIEKNFDKHHDLLCRPSSGLNIRHQLVRIHLSGTLHIRVPEIILVFPVNSACDLPHATHSDGTTGADHTAWQTVAASNGKHQLRPSLNHVGPPKLNC